MKKSRFTETQIVAILKEVDAGMKVAEVCRKYGGLEASDLKRMYAEMAMVNDALEKLIDHKHLPMKRSPVPK